MVITEWMYDGSSEFIEFTNTGNTAIDMAGWSFDDNSRAPGSVSLSGFGLVQPGQSAILCDLDAVSFSNEWNISGITIVGGNTNNLSRSDEVNLYDNTGALVDRLTYNDQGGLGPRTSGTSGVTAPANYGANNAASWQLSALSDGLSWTADSGNIGSPGVAAGATAVPEASTTVLLGAAGLAMALRRRHN